MSARAYLQSLADKYISALFYITYRHAKHLPGVPPSLSSSQDNTSDLVLSVITILLRQTRLVWRYAVLS